MRKELSLLLPIALVAALSCTREMTESSSVDELALARTKTVCLADEYDEGSFLIKFESVPDDRFIASLESDGIASVKPLFPRTPGKEELEERFGLDRWYVAELSENASLKETVARTAVLKEVAVAEYNCLMTKDAGESYPADMQTRADGYIFNDPLLPDQWHYRNTGSHVYAATAVKGADINVYDVWQTLGIYGDPDIIVAVVDEGVKYTHPDLAANMWKNDKEIPGNGIDDDGNGYVDDIYGYNFVTNGPVSWGKSGDSGHGTHCAGTIAAVNNNGIGVSGVAGGSGKGDGCRIMSCQIFSANAGGTVTATARAVKYAADMGASVISCSFGYSGSIASDDAYYRSNSAEVDAVHYFETSSNNPVLSGNIAVFAAGNETHSFAHYPGAFVDIISVSAFGPDFLPTYYTNYGPGCSIAAPGGEMGLIDSYKSMVLSTMPNEQTDVKSPSGPKAGSYEYGYMQGTSMACPHVSGVVALALSYAKRLGKTFGRDEFKQLILSSTNDVDQRIASKKEKSYVTVPAGEGYIYKPNPNLSMTPYYHQMGTGAIDAWQLMMQIEGVPTLVAKLDDTSYIDLSPYLGTSSVSLTYLDLEVPQATVDALGLTEIKASNTNKYPAVPEKGYAYIQYGRLYMHPTKVGSGKVKIHVVGGGDHLGGGSNPPGGMEIVTEVSVISREIKTSNGGWL